MSSEIGAVVLPSPRPSPAGEGVDVGMSRMLWAGSKAKVSLRPVWLDAASLVGALDQVAGFVVGVAAAKHGTTKVV